MKVGVLFTGGKDSTYALHIAYLQGFDVEVLLSIIPHYEYSMLYQRPVFDLLKLQAQSMKIPLLSIGLRERGNELHALYKLLLDAKKFFNIKGVFSGALLSDYQRMRYSIVAEKLGLKTYNPLWRIDQKRYMLELVENGIEFIILSINTYGIPLSFLGKKIELKDIYELLDRSKKYGFNPAFEGGECETFVVNAPLFKKEIFVKGKPVRVSQFEGYLKIEKYGFMG
ncbi:MAG: diphthine--ammonia ligase [Staphylothermus sp.]|nr:diphthine--ammonia ligase [Staphylothermus sp.]